MIKEYNDDVKDYRYKMNLYIGGKDGKKIYYGKPIIYDNKNIQPQLTPDFFVSSNHFYVFTLISIIGFLSFIKKKHIRLLEIYLILLSIILETFHLIIPGRSFEWSDLLGNLLGVFIVIISNILIKKYGYFKK